MGKRMGKSITRWKWIKENWKMIIHLLLGTKRFGVNNKWWNEFDSIFGIPWYKRTPRKIYINYQGAKFRAIACYFISDKTKSILFERKNK
jgi:hypothetical protein